VIPVYSLLLVCVLPLQVHTRPRVQRAPGVPHALFGRTIQQSLGRIAPRDCGRSSSPWNLRFRFEEQLNLDFESGTGRKRAGYPGNLLIPGSSGALKNADRY
jgi:hypothetical protein